MLQPAGERPLVLLVDDCGEVRDLYEMVLTTEFNVVVASRGEEAIALAVARQPQIIVLDIEMPGIDGLEVCRQLKRNPSTARIPVVMLTGSNYIRDDTVIAGAFGVLDKPCPEHRLVDTILTALTSAPQGGRAA
jgi:CheY-like chemotaxis protein